MPLPFTVEDAAVEETAPPPVPDPTAPPAAPEATAASAAPGEPEGEGRVVRVVPDVAGISRRFDYRVPARMADDVGIGSLVRIDLHGRRVAAWVVELDPAERVEVELKDLARLTGRGPSSELVELAEWAAWRWAGRPRTFLRAASPPGRVVALPAAPGPEARPATVVQSDAASGALSLPRAVLRLPPAADRYGIVVAAVAATPPEGDVLVLCPSVAQAQSLARRLRRARLPVACVAHDRPGTAAAKEWARAAAGGCVVVGARAAAFAPMPRLARVVVLDEHDEAYQEESSPTWHARDVVVERARRLGAPVVLVSPCPTLEAQAWGQLLRPSRGEERRGWPVLDIVDRTQEDPAAGLLTEPLATLLHREERVLCVVNRVGRSRLSACDSCRSIVSCEVCEGAMAQPAEGALRCTRCGRERPAVCRECGATRFRTLRPGVSRLREELAALLGEPVEEVTAASEEAAPTSRVVIGTEAVLHRVPQADAVAFLDFDQELLAPRERAREQAFALLARAARVVRGRDEHGRLLVQTRRPGDVVLQAALLADPGRVAAVEAESREQIGAGPACAVALVSGPAAPAFVEALGRPDGVEVQGGGGQWRLRAATHEVLCDALASVERPPGRLRIEVDPLRA